MLYVRSVAYLVCLYVLTIIAGILMLPVAVFGGRPATAKTVSIWAHTTLAGLWLLCGLRHELRGREKLPNGVFLVASKHQSMWETLYFLTLVPDAAIVVKSELWKLPIYGWYTRQLRMISVDRSLGASALKDMARQAEAAAKDGRSVVIFPEGTRRAPGAPPDYKPGVAMLYQRLGVPCVPVALNSGLYWQGQGILRRPGKILVEILDPIPPGLERKAFMSELEARTEAASERLRLEAQAARHRTFEVEPQQRHKQAAE